MKRQACFAVKDQEEKNNQITFMQMEMDQMRATLLQKVFLYKFFYLLKIG